MSDYTISAKFEGQDVSATSTANKVARSIAGVGEAAEKAGAKQSKYQASLAGVERNAAGAANALRPLALAFAGASVASGVTAARFEETFARSVGLAGLAANEVGKVEEATKRLAVATGQSPQALAEGFYFISSAGIEGKNALDALEASAKGAAAGLGSTAVVADAATSAMNAYGVENMTAARAVDVLAQTAKEGKAEAADLAPQFGRLLPVAAQLGVTFEEVGGGLAYLTRNSGNAHLATTELAGIMRKLLDPSEQARKTLGLYGITADELRAKVGRDGLQKTLNDLYTTFGGNTDALSAVFDDYEAFNGVLSLTGRNATEAGKVFDAMKNSAGTAGEAFRAVSGGDGFKAKQSLSEVKVAALELGETLLPVGADILHLFAGLASGVAGLPEPVRLLGLGLGGATVAAYGLAKAIETAPKVGQTLSKLGNLGAGTLGAIGAVAGGLTILGLAYNDVAQRSANAKKLADDYTSSLSDQSKAVKELNDQFIAQQLGSKGKLGNLAAVGLTTGDFAKGATGTAKEYGDLANRLYELDRAMNGTKKNADALVGALADQRTAAVQSTAATLNAALTNDKLGRSAIEAAAGAKLPVDQFATLQRILADGVATTEELESSNLSLVDVLGLVRDLGGQTAAQASALGAASAGSADGMGTAAAAAGILTGALAELSSVYSTMVSAGIGYERAQLGLEDANQKLAEAQEAVATGGKSLQKAQSGGGAAADSAAKAQRRLEDALRGVESANRRVEDAKRSIADAEERQVDAEKKRAQRVDDLTAAYQKLNDVQYGKNDTKTVAGAEAAVARGERDKTAAAIDLERAKLRQQQSEEAYAKVVADSGSTALDRAQADLDRRDAALAVIDAQDRIKKTEDDLIEARRVAQGETKGYAAGSDELKDALDGVKKAEREMKDADREVADSHREVEDRNRDLEDALRGVKDAEQNVIDVQNDRVAGGGAYGGTVKTQAQLERDLKDALLGQKEALNDVVNGAAEAALSQQAYADKLSGRVTPEAELNALKTKAQVDKLKELRDQFAPGSDLRNFLDQWIGDLERVPAVVKTKLELQVLADTAKGLVALGGNALDLIAPDDLAALNGARAMGGPVYAGGSYLVGERQPEVFVPSSSGYIYPSVAAANASGAGALMSGGGDTYINVGGVNVSGHVLTEVELLDFVENELRRRMKARN